MAKKVVAALVVVAFMQCLFVLCFVSAAPLQVPRNMPLGATGTSAVLTTVQSTPQVSFQTLLYPSQSAAQNAINHGTTYGAYITPSSGTSTLLTSSQKSFFAYTEILPLFEKAAKQVNQPITTKDVKPLPKGDIVGAVVTLLLVPTIDGGLVAAVLVFQATRTAARTGRVTTLIGYAVLGAFITDLVAGPWLGAYSGSHFWPLLPCLILVTAAAAVFTAGLHAAFKSLGTLLALILLIFMGFASSGGAGVSLLPVYWQNIGAWLPNRYAVLLYQNTLYFGGHSITGPILALAAYLLVGACLIFAAAWVRNRGNRASVPVPAGQASAPVPAGQASVAVPAGQASAASRPGPSGPGNLPDHPDPGNSPGQPNPGNSPGQPGSGNRPARSGRVLILAALAFAAIFQFLYTLTYMSSGHSPAANNMPFGVTGSSSILTAVRNGGLSLKVIQYPNEQAAKNAINQAEIWGALIPGSSSSTLLTVPSASDLAPAQLPVRFEQAAAAEHQVLHVQEYTPTPLAAKDPFGLVPAVLILPLLFGGYMVANLLVTATGTAARRWRGVTLAGYALVVAMLINLIVVPWLGGYPASKFWIVWPIMALIICVASLLAAVLRSLLGALGTLLTIAILITVGNPSKGGANGVYYLNNFWRDIGPYLPDRNAYILLHNTIYFNGSNITQALVVLLIYLVVCAVILGVLDWYRTPTPPAPVTPETIDAAAAMAVGGAAS